MKRFIQSTSLVLAILMILATPAFAAEHQSSRESSYFMRASVYLNKTSATSFQACFDVTATHSMQKLGARTIKIQRSADGSNWETIRTYSMDSYSHFICENTVFHGSSISHTGTPTYYYRAYVALYAKDSSGSAEWYLYSNPLKL